MKILIATHNKGKVSEFKQLFEPFGIEVSSLHDFPELPEVAETGQTFEENARLKAETIAQLTQSVVLADDSGLCVDALDGAPGIYSARYAGEPTNSQKNNEKLLAELAHSDNRRAHFTCCLVVAHPKMPSLVVEAIAEGVILRELSGQAGFGYDPLFYYEAEKCTFAQMSPEQKNAVSHRGKALAQLVEQLPNWLKELKEK